MRISELSSVTGVPVASIKFYLRERVLPPGVLTATTRAEYDDSHVQRLRLIRAMIDSGVAIAGVRSVTSILDADEVDPLALLASAHAATTPATPGGDELDLDRARALAARLTDDEPSAALLQSLAQALQHLRAADFTVPPVVLDSYVEAARSMAAAELAAVPEDPAEAAAYVALGSTLSEPLVLALRRIAEEAAAVRFVECVRAQQELPASMSST